MGAFQFTWPHQAGEVLITGTFDNWSGSVKLKKDPESGLFTGFVDLGDADKVLYKYIVDGHWTVNYDAKREYDYSGNENNVLYAEDLRTPTPSIKEKAIPISGETDGGMDTPPMVSPDLDAVPGGFPETPAQEQKEEEILSVNPLPASTTAGNPITLQPGESVPAAIILSTDDTVHLDEESYEKADASNLGVPAQAPVLPEVVTPAAEREAKGTGILDVPEILSAPVVEEETPAASVPEIVKESQAIAQASPEASVDEALVEKKAEVEQELINEPPHLQHVEVEEEAPLVTAQEVPTEAPAEVPETPVSEKSEIENQPPVTNPRSVSPTMSPLTTPAAPTTHVYTCSVPGATFANSPAEPAPSTRSSSASSRESSHNEKINILSERTPEKKKEKRRSVILGRILNFFK